VLVTHDQGEALSLADQVAVMRGGRLVQLDAPATVYRSPSDAGVARFVGEAVLLPATLRGGVASCALGDVAAREPAGDGPAEILVRPEQIQLHTEPEPGSVAARVTDVSYFGHDAAVRLETLPGAVPVTARVTGHDMPALGSTVWLAVVGDAPTFPATTAPVPDEVGLSPR
jgi:iron(III) transport system ATP-binding protein